MDQKMERAGKGFEIKKDFFTPKETSIYELFIQGFSKKEIAIAVCRSVKTVEKQIDSTYKKLKVHSAPEAVHKGYLKGIIKLTTTIMAVFIMMNSFFCFTEVNRRTTRKQPRFSYKIAAAQTRNIVREIHC